MMKLMTKMKRDICGWICVVYSIILLVPAVAYAEGRSGKDYMDEGKRAVYHNMHLLYEAYYDDSGELEEQPLGYVAIEQEWDGEGNLLSRTYLDENGSPKDRKDGFSRVNWQRDVEGIWHQYLYNSIGEIVQIPNMNLVRNIAVENDGWSEWMTPEYAIENYIILVGEYTPCGDSDGDLYTCTVDIEFKDVTVTENKQFAFRTAGPTNDTWDNWQNRNMWNFSFVSLDEVPTNGVYTFTKTIAITNEMLKRNLCQIGFRCDFWKSGAFRIRNVKIEKGNIATQWTPGL